MLEHSCPHTCCEYTRTAGKMHAEVMTTKCFTQLHIKVAIWKFKHRIIIIINCAPTQSSTLPPKKINALEPFFAPQHINVVSSNKIPPSTARKTIIFTPLLLCFCAKTTFLSLGDFAIYLKQGLSKSKALLINFAAACCCYIGLYVGIALSEDPGIRTWLLSFVAGMFLYVSFVNLVSKIDCSCMSL